MSVQIVFTQMVIIFLLMITGYVLIKRQILDQHGVKQISALVTNVCNPALLITSAFSEENQASNMDALQVLGIAAVMFAVLVVLGFAMGHILRAKKEDHTYYTMLTVFGNLGFIGIPLSSALLGAGALIYVAIFNLSYYIMFYTFGMALLDRKAGGTGGLNLKLFINPGTVASLLTIIIFALKIPVHAVIGNTLQYMGNATTFLAIMVIGTSLARVSLKEMFLQWRMYIFIVIRFVLVPMVGVYVMRHFVDNSLIVGTTVLMLSVPAGNMPLMLATEKGLDGKLLSQGIILSTILSLITVPLATMLL